MTADTYLVLFFRFCSKYFTYRISFNLIFNNNPLSSLLLLLLLLLSSYHSHFTDEEAKVQRLNNLLKGIQPVSDRIQAI